MTDNAITVQTTIAAPIEKVWKAWTEPEHIVHWNFASEDWHCPAASNDLQPGGVFRSTMASKDGQMQFEFEGAYDAVVYPNQIAYTIADGRKVQIRFEDLDGKTRVTETFEPENIHEPALQQAGWQAILDQFKKYAETL